MSTEHDYPLWIVFIDKMGPEIAEEFSESSLRAHGIHKHLWNPTSSTCKCRGPMGKEEGRDLVGSGWQSIQGLAPLCLSLRKRSHV